MNYRERIALVTIYIIAVIAGAMFLISIGYAIRGDEETALMEKNCNGNVFVRNNSVYVCVKVKAEGIK